MRAGPPLEFWRHLNLARPRRFSSAMSGRSKAVEYSVRLKEILHEEENSKNIQLNEAREKKIKRCFELVDSILAETNPMSDVLGRVMREIKDAIYRYEPTIN